MTIPVPFDEGTPVLEIFDVATNQLLGIVHKWNNGFVTVSLSQGKRQIRVRAIGAIGAIAYPIDRAETVS